jgi:hypothetical protein
MEEVIRLLLTCQQTLFSCVGGDFLYWLITDFLRRNFYQEDDNGGKFLVIFRRFSRISLIGIRIIVTFGSSRDRF